MTSVDKTRCRKYLKDFDFKRLFIQELGWDHYSAGLEIPLNNHFYNLSAIAQKRGMVVFICSPFEDGFIPENSIRCKIEIQVAKSFHEHFIIYTDKNKTAQIWLWVRREAGKPLARRNHKYTINQPGDSLIQKLQSIAFSLEEEDTLTITDVTRRVKGAFDLDRVTKRFYDRFKKEHSQFLGFIEGITETFDREWYASVMLNRLMFVYFIQKKSFLDSDPDYLRNRLNMIQEKKGKNKFLGFYRHFLLRLFHEGLGRPDHSAELDELIGHVPYLNGGLFLLHSIEEKYKNIQIPDDAFEKIFDFFDQYQWHLDERPLKADNEINPDVLGYIFEKYINQKQMGAYYTKEDITDYISKNTIIPFLFDTAEKKAGKYFKGENSIWTLLQSDPDRYIYEAVRKGIDKELPPEIKAGLKDISKRGEWNKPAPEDYALPTEIWREVVARRSRYEEVRSKILHREIHSINDFITYNLNIRQFAQDVIENCESPELLRAFWHAIEKVTVLDPTCGSGAFLFAALNILEPLYDACLDRMQSYLEELDSSGEKHRPEKFSDFRNVLSQIEKHPNRRYFIFKSIIINNLFGVDIMEEAVEICKLRLFLKLVAQVESVDNVEPLPDIDFNIRAGNTLVGFATYEEVERAVTSKLDFDNTMGKIEEKAGDVDRLFGLFRKMQTAHGMDSKDFVEAKKQLRDKLKILEDTLNRYLAGEYGIEEGDKKSYKKWLESHQPFHWFIQFYGIIKAGGFDVIIGNPPYVEYSKIKKDYSVKGYKTESCGNLYAMMIERSFRLLFNNGRKGMIVPHSSICTDRMEPLISIFSKCSQYSWFSTYCIRPSKLFIGVDQRLAIYIVQKGNLSLASYSSKYHRWQEEFRSYLFHLTQYINVSKTNFPNSIPKIHSIIECNLWTKLMKFLPLSKNLKIKYSEEIICFHNAPRYWIRAMDFTPYFWNEREGEQISGHVKSLSLLTKLDSSVVVTVLNSSLFYFWFITLSNCRDLTLREIETFPIDLNKMKISVKNKLAELCVKLMKDLKSNAQRKECQYKTTGKVIYDEFYPKYSKPIIDEIDRVLAEHYGFTEEELDFIINYDIKYRM
ncbi:MAG TPA: Eco57I restriction-modification methylase domain-containing protein, partial [Candidatus Eremiobacteraeota bacterium]|nr:Eco57I restriction-modification methylase domain-containing protein [Candidatus Eremiobacteraeota bacterium]